MTKIKVLMRYLDLPYNKSNISSTFGRENRECAAHTALENLFFFFKEKNSSMCDENVVSHFVQMYISRLSIRIKK